MKRLLLASTILLAAGCASLPGMAPLSSGVDRAGGDATTRPQDDFFRHVNGTWLKTTPIPPDKAYAGSFDILHDRIQIELRGLVEAAAKSADSEDARRIGDLYESFMDEAALEKSGLAPLTGELAAIDAVTAPSQLAAAIGRLSRIGPEMPFDLLIYNKYKLH